MRVVALIDHDRQPEVVEKILKHCKLWKEPGQRGPPAGTPLPPDSEVRDQRLSILTVAGFRPSALAVTVRLPV